MSLLGDIATPFRAFPNDLLRSLRAIHILEKIGSDESRKILEALAEGSLRSWQTREAAAALRRLEGQAISE